MGPVFYGVGKVSYGGALRQQLFHLLAVAAFSAITHTPLAPIEIPFQPEMKPIPGLSAPIRAQLGAS